MSPALGATVTAQLGDRTVSLSAATLPEALALLSALVGSSSHAVVSGHQRRKPRFSAVAS